MRSIATRLRQGLLALVGPHPNAGIPARWSASVPSGVQSTWGTLSGYDQHHLIEVAADLERAGEAKATVLAGLLHDIGKAGGISLPARVAAVLVKRLSPSLAERIRRMGAPPQVLHGLHLLLTHAERGARLLESHGMEARVVWLVKYHEDDLPDPALAALRAADERH